MAPLDPTHEVLLRRFQPRLRYDSNEAFFADSAAEWTDNPGNVLRRFGPEGEAGEVIAAAKPQHGQEMLSLEFLGNATYRNGMHYEAGDAISDPARDYRDQYVALRQKGDYRNRMYGRAKEDSGGRLWLQYWFFYFYNDYNLAGGIGLHEGDWEMVQFRMHDDSPDLALYAQHRWAERRTWDEVERPEGSPDTPVVYVARGSHASYFERGYHETEAWYDIADGNRPTPNLRLEFITDDAPSWASWQGHWGDTRARVGGVDQPSPTGPFAHDQWRDPALLLASSKTPERKKPSSPPEVTIERQGGRLVLQYDFSRRSGSQPEKLVVTVNSRDDRVPPRTFTFGVQNAVRGRMETRVPLADNQHYDIYVSTTDASGRPSESKLTLLDPAGSRQAGGLPILPVLGRAVERIRRLLGRGG